MREFRFGFHVDKAFSGTELRQMCRTTEDFGFDIALLPDHLDRDFPGPFATMAVVAGASERLRVGTLVLNTCFWNPTVLAREAAAVDRLTDGRLELGFGAGYARHEFEAAGIAWQPFGERVGGLEQALDAMERLFSPDTPNSYPIAQSPRPPVLLAGASDRMLKLAAQRADIVSHTPITPLPGGEPGSFRYRFWSQDEFGERVKFFQQQAAERLADVEIHFPIAAVLVTDDPQAAVAEFRAARGLEDKVEDLLQAPGLLVGTVDQIAAQVLDYRERYGITYLSVFSPFIPAFGPVIQTLRRQPGI
jgi:probable F420-dependent oxidoreductase